MSETVEANKTMLTEDVMLSRLNKSDEMREFFIQMWRQNPALAKQGGAKVRRLLSELPLPPGEGWGGDEIAQPGKSQRGISLIELIMFIVIVSVALAGILLVMNVTTKSSADPLIHKQALAIAESLLEEVELMPFTFCDPDDPAAGLDTTVDTTPCTMPAGGEAIGPETGETRYDTTFPFDNVNDYHGFGMASGSILDITGANTGLTGYTLQPITVAAIDFGGITAASGDALLITVTVTGPDNVPVVVDGIRTRYAPNTTP